MNLENRINAFDKLGKFLRQFKSEECQDDIKDINHLFYDEFNELMNRQKAYNGWFDRESVINAVTEIGNSLTEKNIKEWVSHYEMTNSGDKTIGVIMAGNIPLVGFHDFLTVLISGNTIHAKLSSDDNTLLKKIKDILVYVNKEFETKIQFVNKLENFNAVIATGSNNTARYFEQYFGKYPNIIRKNRNSVAVINQKDSKEDLKLLGHDIFSYYGLGCRSVSKLYVPEGYNWDYFFEAIYEDYKEVINNNKYANNYDYNKAIYLLGNNSLLDNNFLLLKEDESISSPVGVLYYEYYNNVEELDKFFKKNQNQLQCIVSTNNTPIDTLSFGEAQCPDLKDYADNIDTLQFLINLA